MMSKYNESKKESVGEAIKQWMLEGFRFRTSEIEIYTHPDHESYVTVELSTDHQDDSWNGFNSETIRRVVKENTDERVHSVVDCSTYSVSVVPDEV